MTVIRVKDLSLRTFIGFKPHEKKHKQDVLIQLEVEVETSMVEHNDDYQADGFYDYRSMTKSVIKLVEESRFDLLEALTRKVLDEIMSNPLVKKAKVEIEDNKIIIKDSFFCIIHTYLMYLKFIHLIYLFD